MEKKRARRVVAISVCVVFSVYVLVSLWVSTNAIVVREYTADTGKSDTGFCAVVISDLHDHRFGGDNEKLADCIRQAEPDIILMDGDMLNDDSEDTSVPLELIGLLKDTAPICYALGNHEIAYMENGHSDLTEELEKAGAVVLDKTYADMEINGVEVRLGGLYDYAFPLMGEGGLLVTSEETLLFLQDFQNTDRMKIMLSHRPDSFIFGEASKVWDVDLVISGHDHGGQVVIPFLGGLYGGDQGWFPEYVHGMYQKDNILLLVTSGLGSNRQILPRFDNPPEVAVLTIQ